MNLGKKIKDKRTLLSLTQEELANRCELTKGYISQLENNKVSPSIETLEIILEVLGTNLSDFFKNDDEPMFIFDKEEQYEKDFSDYKQTWLIPNAQNKQMEAIIVEILPGGSTFHDYPHPGEEFGYVLDGEITVVYGDNKRKCFKGESFYFLSNKNHYLINESENISKIIWVSSPPNF